MPDAGWYDDPSGSPEMLRYWDGVAWTAHRRHASELLYPPPVGPARAGPDIRAESSAPERRGAYERSAPSNGSASSREWDPVHRQYVINPRPAARPPTAVAEPQQPPSNGFSTAGIAMGIIALVIFPPVFGIVGIVFSGIAFGRRESNAAAALAVSIGGMLAGMALGVMVWSGSGGY